MSTLVEHCLFGSFSVCWKYVKKSDSNLAHITCPFSSTVDVALQYKWFMQGFDPWWKFLTIFFFSNFAQNFGNSCSQNKEFMSPDKSKNTLG